MALNSNVVASGDDALYTQYNDIRKDIIQRAGEYAIAGGTTDVLTLAVDAQITAYITGQVIIFQASATNTGAVTINVNSIGAKAIKRKNGDALSAGDIVNGRIYFVIYNGINFYLYEFIADSQSALLVGGVASNADSLHTHTGLVLQTFIHTFTYSLSTASGTTVIAHGLGISPKLIKAEAYYGGLRSLGSSDGTSNKCIYFDSSNALNSSTRCIYLGDSSNRQEATITVDATNITVNWTKAGIPTGTSAILLTAWE